MDLFFTYFEKPHVVAKFNEKELKTVNEINKKLKLVNRDQKNIAFLVKDRKHLLEKVKVEAEESLLQIDIREFFYSINHKILLEKVREVAPKILSKLEDFLSELNKNLQMDEFKITKGIENKCGLVLGHEVFFRLASIYLKDIDKKLNESQKVSQYYRFIDDTLIATKYSNEIIYLVETELQKIALEVNYEKLIVTPPRQSFTYLKQEFSRPH